MIKCLENIPEKWKVGRVKDIFYISKDKAHQKDPVILSLARDGIKVRDISNNEGQIAESYENYNPVKPGDLLLNPMDLYSGANCNMSLVEGVISPAYVNLRKKFDNVNPRYFDYYFKVQYWTMNMFAHGKGVSFDNRWTLNTEGVLNFEIPIPSFEEQNKISEFLDKKCNQIEKLLKLQEKEIEKLKEYKQSVIVKAVTKGIVENIELKESGVPTLGKIPKHWSLRKILYSFEKMGSGTTPKASDDLNYEGEYNWIQSGDLGDRYLTKTKAKISEKALNSSSLTIYKAPFLVIAMYGASIGNVSISKIDACTNQACCVLVNPKKDTIPEFIYYVVIASKERFAYLSNGGGQPNISQEIIRQFRIGFPKKEEQIDIVEFLDKKCFAIDDLIEKKKLKIKKLQEYKKSLIYECVTGKKEI